MLSPGYNLVRASVKLMMGMLCKVVSYDLILDINELKSMPDISLVEAWISRISLTKTSDCGEYSSARSDKPSNVPL